MDPSMFYLVAIYVYTSIYFSLCGILMIDKASSYWSLKVIFVYG